MSDSEEKIEEVYIRLGDAIRAARDKNHLTQAYVAQQVGLDRTSIINIERGRHRIQVHTLSAIANTLGVSPRDLMPETGPGLAPDLSDEERGLLPPDLTPEEAEWLSSVFSAAGGAGPVLEESDRIVAESCFPASFLRKARVEAPPVPIEDLARRCGFRVVAKPFRGDVAGVRNSLRNVIGVNSLHSPERRRYAVALILAAYLTTPYVQLPEWPLFFVRRFSFSPEHELPLYPPPMIEECTQRELAHYAMVLLTPKSLLDRDVEGLLVDIEDDAEVSRLASRYGVSPQLMALRLFSPIAEELIRNT
jgi:transcriptional regulator with XRE-family HTH domain